VLKLAGTARGFTIVEVLITILVIGVLIALGAPSFGEWLQGQQLRGAAEASLNGLQLARAEAIRRNGAVQIVFAPPETGWTVLEGATVIQTRSHAEGTPNAQLTVTPGGATTVTFTALGSVTANADGSSTVQQLDLTNPSGGACQPTGAMRCLRVVVSAGGTVRMCDPTPGVVAPDPRAC
jgi:type IV fimbrial biogenesis protein FimT